MFTQIFLFVVHRKKQKNLQLLSNCGNPHMYDEKNPVEFLAPKIGNHMKLQLERLKKWNLEETVNYLEQEVNLISEEDKKRMTEF